MKKRMMLYFGSFDPIHRGHVALAEYAVERDLCDELTLVVSPQNPLKAAEAQTPEMLRFEMAKIACRASRFPERIKPSVVEFLLEKPSYTVRTLRYLAENFGGQMDFSILMGADLIAQFDRWRDYREILDRYPIFVYPRPGFDARPYADRVVYLDGAPAMEISSTRIRQALERDEAVGEWLQPEVERYIRSRGLWSSAGYVARLTERIGREPENADLYVERAKWHYRRNEWGAALNDFNRALKADPAHCEARQMVELVQEILAFRYTDIYNP